MTALIDADLVAYRCAATVSEEEDKEIAFYRIDVLMRQILDAVESEEFIAFLSGKNNFRKKLNPEYKANRKDIIPPVYLQDCRQYLIDEWKAIVSEGCEADDKLGVAQTSETILCSLDKDLRMIPGQHYNWVKVDLDTVNSQDALRHFYKQMLIGDKSDNIIGVDKIGPVKAGKLIDPLDDEQDMFDVVWSKYNKDAQRFLMNANCLWIWRKENELWQDRQNLVLPNDLQQEVITTSEFMKSLNQDTSMVPITTQIQTSGGLDNGTGMEKTL